MSKNQLYDIMSQMKKGTPQVDSSSLPLVKKDSDSHGDLPDGSSDVGPSEQTVDVNQSGLECSKPLETTPLSCDLLEEANNADAGSLLDSKESMAGEGGVEPLNLTDKDDFFHRVLSIVIFVLVTLEFDLSWELARFSTYSIHSSGKRISLKRESSTMGPMMIQSSGKVSRGRVDNNTFISTIPDVGIRKHKEKGFQRHTTSLEPTEANFFSEFGEGSRYKLLEIIGKGSSDPRNIVRYVALFCCIRCNMINCVIRFAASGLKLDSYSTTVYEKVSIQRCDGDEAKGEEDFDKLESKSLYAFIYPNFMVNSYGAWMNTNLVLPLGPRRCKVIFDYFLDASLKDDKAFVTRSLKDSEQVQKKGALCSDTSIGQGGTTAWKVLQHTLAYNHKGALCFDTSIGQGGTTAWKVLQHTLAYNNVYKLRK
ncbi:hypothetical protein Lser_V15G26990 [Lactuca serriola]